MIFENVKEITIPQGTVVKITNASNILLWSADTNGLPNIYQEVEYVQANAEAWTYIDLGFAFDTACKIYIGLRFEKRAGAYPFGAAENSGKLRCMISAPYNSNISGYGSDGSNYITVALTANYDNGGRNDIIFKLQEGKAEIKNETVNEYKKNEMQAAYKMTNNLYLFAQNYNGTIRYGGERKISYFKYYDKNDELICDLVPCYRKSDGVIGMYDRARKIFLTNMGRDAFTKGADV